MNLEKYSPTELEQKIATLHNAKYALTFTSGLSAVAMVTYLYKPNGHIVVGQNVSDGPVRLFEKILPPRDIVIHYADTLNIDAYKDRVPGSSAFFIETAPNPIMSAVDISAASTIARDAGSLLIVKINDMPPYIQHPLDLGADIVIEDAAKFFGGNNGITAGVMVTNDPALYEFVKTVREIIGTELSLHSTELLETSLKGLPLSIDWDPAV